MEEILLCTHDPILVKGLYGILRDKGCGVEIADHLALAIQMILKKHYYFAIIDGKPFGLSVEDAVEIMKTVSPEMPIIVVKNTVTTERNNPEGLCDGNAREAAGDPVRRGHVVH